MTGSRHGRRINSCRNPDVVAGHTHLNAAEEPGTSNDVGRADVSREVATGFESGRDVAGHVHPGKALGRGHSDTESNYSPKLQQRTVNADCGHECIII